MGNLLAQANQALEGSLLLLVSTVIVAFEMAQIGGFGMAGEAVPTRGGIGGHGASCGVSAQSRGDRLAQICPTTPMQGGDWTNLEVLSSTTGVSNHVQTDRTALRGLPRRRTKGHRGGAGAAAAADSRVDPHTDRGCRTVAALLSLSRFRPRYGLCQPGRRAGRSAGPSSGDSGGVGQGDGALVDAQDPWLAPQRFRHGSTD